VNIEVPPTSVLAPGELEATVAPIADATGLPNRAYTDPALFEAERDGLMARTWVALSFLDRLAPGTLTPLDFMGLPLLAVRTADGEVAVYHNVCSHRGMQLVTEPRPIRGPITCGYHCWAYAPADGALKATPHIGGFGVHEAEGFDKTRHGLRRVASHVWNRVLFVNIDGTAPPFETEAAAVIDRYTRLLGPGGQAELTPAATHAGTEIDLAANWKLVIENYLESYHLPFVHPGLSSYSPVDDHSNHVIAPNCAGQATERFTTQSGGTGLPRFTGWDPARPEAGEYPVLYPNLMLGYQPDHAFAIIVHPLAPGRSRMDLMLFYTCEEAASSPEHEAARAANAAAWASVFDEDKAPCEGMQAGRESPGYSGGAFSPVLDTCPHHFAGWVARGYAGIKAAL
jgi:choline monooxygenase